MERRRYREGHDGIGEDGPGPGRRGRPHPRVGSAHLYTGTHRDTAAHRYPLPAYSDTDTWACFRASPHGCPGVCCDSCTYGNTRTDCYTCTHSNAGAHTHAITDPYAYPFTHAHAGPHSYRDAVTDTHTDPDPNSDPRAHADASPDGHACSHSNANAGANRNAYSQLPADYQ